jgi:calcium-dependent protein kinase
MSQSNFGRRASFFRSASEEFQAQTEVIYYEEKPEEKGPVDEKVEKDSASSNNPSNLTGLETAATISPKAKQRVSVTSLTAGTPSEALQCIVENPGKLHDYYALNKTLLGKGHFGSVQVGTVNASGAKRAIKTIVKKELTSNRVFAEEIKILKMLDHLHIVKLYEAFEDDSSLYLVMALSTHGTLRKYVHKERHLSITKTKHSMRNLISAVNYLHHNLICHRDVKPDNILVHQTTPLSLRLTDFGLAKRFQKGQIFTSEVGTPCFMAPEVFRHKYTEVCDVWSCGVVMYMLLSGTLPFDAHTVEEIKEKILNKTPAFNTPAWAEVPSDTWLFLDLMLKKDPRARYTADQAFHHGWLKLERKGPAVEITQDMLNNLRTFRKGNKLKRSALIVCASMLKTEDVLQSHRVFMSLDINGDGQISFSEMKQELPSRIQASDVVKMFEQDDISKDAEFEEDEETGSPFSYTEFIAATFNRQQCITKAISQAAFVSYDKDGDGQISMAELASGQLLGHLSMEDTAKTLEDLDANGDGFVDREEFHSMLLSW